MCDENLLSMIDEDPGPSRAGRFSGSDVADLENHEPA
jgi:hypothetical protein